MKRLYDQLLYEQIEANDIMVFLAGPRQIGKTTTSQTLKAHYDNFNYFNWDERTHREIILAGSPAIAEFCQLNQLSKQKACIVFDELHKYSDWKNSLKGFYDLYKDQCHIVVTGSSRLDTFRKGGDSLMGRYFLYRMHPLSVNELLRPKPNMLEIQEPTKLSKEKFMALWEFGGYPKPYVKSNPAFSTRWKQLREQQLIREDIRDMTRIQELQQLEILSNMLKTQAASLLTYSSLAKHIRVSIQTISRWIQTLSDFYYCFAIKPWHKNVSRSLIKEPKVFLWDWSFVEDPGSRFENMIASHLLKAVHYWNDVGLGNYDLFYLRDLEKREVDFLVSRNGEPWFIVEAKVSGKQALSASLGYFQEQTKAQCAFQVCLDLPYVDVDCFSETKPIKVSALTFLSQLV